MSGADTELRQSDDYGGEDKNDPDWFGKVSAYETSNLRVQCVDGWLFGVLAVAQPCSGLLAAIRHV